MNDRAQIESEEVDLVNDLSNGDKTSKIKLINKKDLIFWVFDSRFFGKPIKNVINDRLDIIMGIIGLIWL